MTLASAIDWEIDAATGSDSNGGGFNRSASGTDKTYGASQAATSWTDLVVNGTTNTKIKSNGGSPRAFDATDVGNVIQITAGTGWSTGFYEITSGPDGSGYMTLDRSPAAVSTTGGTGTLGGSLLTPGVAGKAHVGGNRIFLKYNASVYSVTSASNNTAGGCVSLSAGVNSDDTVFEGYHSTRGDWDGTRPTMQGSGISNFTLVAMGTQTRVGNVILDGNNLTTSHGISPGTGRIVFVKSMNHTSSAFGTGSTSTTYIACEATGVGPLGSAFGGGIMVFCSSHDNSCTGFNITGTGGGCFFCVSSNNTGSTTDGFDVAAKDQVINCAADNNGRHGFNLSSAVATAVNCVATNHTAVGAKGFAIAASETSPLLVKCAGYNNTTNVDSNYATLSNIGFITLTADPFTNASGGDFSLNSTAGGGASCRAAGYPTTAPGLSTTLHISIGAAQLANVTPGGGANLLGLGTLVA